MNKRNHWAVGCLLGVANTVVGCASDTGKAELATAAGGASTASGSSTGIGGMNSTGGTAAVGSASATGGALGTSGASGALPQGWLYTSGNKVYVSNGTGSGTVWVGRGVNIDDIYFCGYNFELWMTNPDQTMNTMIQGLMTGWKPTFLRISMSMNSGYGDVSWLTNPASYKTPMTNVINTIGTYANTYVLVSVRTDSSMLYGTVSDPEPTALPSDSTTTPNASAYPTGTDALYVALVNSFASSKHVLFGLTNEPGGNSFSNAKIAAAMNHAVGVIRKEEDRLGVPHHVIAVQGNSWTSNISFYSGSAKPITYDNVVYEVHGYPPLPSEYTFSDIPVIIGEYGTLSNAATFFADLESKQIPSLAWDFQPFSNCAPDLVAVTQSATTLTPNAWGTTVRDYLRAHAN